MMSQSLREGEDPGQEGKGVLWVRCLSSSDGHAEGKETKEDGKVQTIYRINGEIYNIRYEWERSAYRVSSQLLNHTRIRPQDREKLKSWMLSETQNLYERETYCHASKYLDMFFMRGQRVQRNAFQALGLACLILAAKVNERRVPSISFQVFDRNQIFNFEKSLLLILNYRLNPVTYISLTQCLLLYWDNYLAQKNPFKTIKYYQPGVQALARVRSIMETLDCLDLVHYSLDFRLDLLVFGVFYIENRRVCLVGTQFKGCQTEDQRGFSTVYDKFMGEFLESLKSAVPAFSKTTLCPKLQVYILNFSRICPRIHINPRYKHFMFQISRQTYNPEITELAQNYLSRRLQ